MQYRLFWCGRASTTDLSTLPNISVDYFHKYLLVTCYFGAYFHRPAEFPVLQANYPRGVVPNYPWLCPTLHETVECVRAVLMMLTRVLVE